MNRTAKVGLLLLAAMIVGGYLILRIEDLRPWRSRLSSYLVKLKDAKGLEEKSAVRLAGVRVGTVSSMELVDDAVEVDLTLSKGVTLREGTTARVISRGMLGDKELELVPGPPDAPPLPPGSLIPERPSVTSLEEVVDIAGLVGEDVKAVTASIRATLADPEGEQRLELILQNVATLTEQLQRMAAANEQNIQSSLQAFRAFSTSMEELSSRLNRISEHQEPVVDQSLENVAAASEHLQGASQNVEQITSGLLDGKGTLGQLLTQTETSERLNAALSSFNALSAAVQKGAGTRVSLGLSTEYLAAPGRAKGYFTLDIHPGEDRLLRLQAVTQPFGVRSDRTVVTTVSGPNGGAPQTTTVVEERSGGDFAFSLMAGVRFRPVTLRAGLFESRAGAGADLWLLDDRLRLTAEMWDFYREGYQPHLKLQGAVYFLPQVYLLGGWDEALNRERQLDSFYLGAGVRWDALGGKKEQPRP